MGALAGLFCMRKAQVIYKLLGERVRGVGFLWFYFQLQGSYVAKRYPGHVDHFESLPADLKARVAVARRQIGYGMVGVVLWVIFVFSFGALAAYLRRHSQS
jgi:hypothetical protein